MVSDHFFEKESKKGMDMGTTSLSDYIARARPEAEAMLQSGCFIKKEMAKGFGNNSSRSTADGALNALGGLFNSNAPENTPRLFGNRIRETIAMIKELCS